MLLNFAICRMGEQGARPRSEFGTFGRSSIASQLAITPHLVPVREVSRIDQGGPNHWNSSNFRFRFRKRLWTDAGSRVGGTNGI